MSTVSAVQRDERTISVENASFRWAYHFLSYGLLLLVAYRSYVQGEAPWDLLGLVFLGGGVASAYQAKHRVVGRQWLVTGLVAVVLAVIAAALLLLVTRA